MTTVAHVQATGQSDGPTQAGEVAATEDAVQAPQVDPAQSGATPRETLREQPPPNTTIDAGTDAPTSFAAGSAPAAASRAQSYFEEQQEQLAATSSAPVTAPETLRIRSDRGSVEAHERQADMSRGGRPIRIECLILPENHTFELDFASNRTFGDAKNRIGELLSVDPANLKLIINDGEYVEDDTPIPARLNPSSDVLSVHLEIDYMHPVGASGFVLPPGATPGDVLAEKLSRKIEVNVEREGAFGRQDVDAEDQRATQFLGFSPRTANDDDEDPSAKRQLALVVSIIRDLEQPMPFLGGLRNKKTGAEYFHANVQTDPTTDPQQAPLKCHRDSQTVEVRSISQQTQREAATQMRRKDVFIDESTDRVVYPRPYFDSEQRATLQEEMAVKIQCAVRIYFARKRARRLIAEHTTDARESHARETRELAEMELQEREDMERRMYPRSKTDFKMLLDELHDWVRQETDAITSDTALTPEEKQFRTLDLLEKETSLLQTIDRLKVRAQAQNKVERLQKTLIEMGKPKVLQLSGDDKTAEVQTPHTMRAKTLAELYNGLRLNTLAREERIDVMLHVKWTVKEFDCDLTREIVSLIDREIDLMKRRRPVASLRGLRKRLAESFLEFLETPEFNPEAARFQKVPVNQEVAPLTATCVTWPADTAHPPSSIVRQHTTTKRDAGVHAGAGEPSAREAEAPAEETRP